MSDSSTDGDGPRLHHIGIACPDFSIQQTLQNVLGQSFGVTHDVAEQGIAARFANLNNAKVELIAPTTAKSPMYPALPNPIATFLKKRGTGLHHICLDVCDLQATLTANAERGIRTLPPGIRTGAEGHSIAFLDPRDTAGILIELLQRA